MNWIRLLVCFLSTGSKASPCERLLTLLRAEVVTLADKKIEV